MFIDIDVRGGIPSSLLVRILPQSSVLCSAAVCYPYGVVVLVSITDW